MPTTPRFGAPVPADTDIDSVPAHLLALATVFDSKGAIVDHGGVSGRPVSSVGTPGIADRFYWATDVDPETVSDPQGASGVLYRDNGQGWNAIGPFASKVAMGQFTMPIVTGNQDITGLGFKPKALEFTYGPNDDSDTNTAHGHGFASSPSNQYASFFRATSASGGIYQRRTRNDRCIHMIDNNGTVTANVDLVAFLTDGFRLIWNTAPGTTANSVQWRAWG